MTVAATKQAPDAQPLVGASEAAEIMDVELSTFSHLRRREEQTENSKFPKPVATLRCGPVWKTSEIKKFAMRYEAPRPGPKPSAPTKTPIKKVVAKAPAKATAKAAPTNGGAAKDPAKKAPAKTVAKKAPAKKVAAEKAPAKKLSPAKRAIMRAQAAKADAPATV